MSVPAIHAADHAIVDWLYQLYSNFDRGWLTAFSVDRTSAQRHTDWTHVDDYETFAKAAMHRATTSCVWFGVATRHEQLPDGRRGGADDCDALPGLWLDIDVAGPNHRTENTLPPDRTAAYRLLRSFPIHPTAIVDTGGGLQAWWLFAEPLALDDDARRLLERWGATWTALAQKFGWHLDNVFDPARIMRLPGTHNRKNTPTPVTILAAQWDHRFGVDDLDLHLHDPPTPATATGERVPYIGPTRPGDAFNAQHHASDLLTATGWTHARTDRNGDQHWTRPGKEPREGTSATIYGDDGHTTIWSDEVLGRWPTLEVRRPYDPFGLYTHLNHRGDWRAASDELESRGYGTKAHPDGDLTDLIAPPIAEAPPTITEPSRYQAGGGWILDAPSQTPAIWGADDNVLWAEGEPLLLTGPPGVGKTTLTGQILRCRLGLQDELLGFPLHAETRGKILYLASDRPAQIRRALGRCFNPDDRQLLNERLTAWPGPPPADLAKRPEILLQMANEAGARTVVLDSLKDMAIGLADDEVGAGLNRSIQMAIADGVEVLALHHQRKGSDGKRPKSLEDLYGSTWISAGAGSVILLWGAAGDLVVELIHLKQPASDVGPLKLEHDHRNGVTTIHRGFDLLVVLRNSPHGMTALDVARLWLEKDKPNDNERKKAQRRLDNLVQLQHAIKEEGARQANGTVGAAVYRYIDSAQALLDTPFSERAEK